MARVGVVSDVLGLQHHANGLRSGRALVGRVGSFVFESCIYVSSFRVFHGLILLLSGQFPLLPAVTGQALALSCFGAVRVIALLVFV